jgi:hypothetical protein
MVANYIYDLNFDSSSSCIKVTLKDDFNKETLVNGYIIDQTSCKKNFSGLKLLDASKITDDNQLKDAISNSKLIFNLELRLVQDMSRQSNSGLDDGIIQIIKSKEITYGFCVEEILLQINSGSLRIISRIKQNLLLLKKAKVHYIFFSKGSVADISTNFKNIKFCKTYFNEI